MDSITDNKLADIPNSPILRIITKKLNDSDCLGLRARSREICPDTPCNYCYKWVQMFTTSLTFPIEPFQKGGPDVFLNSSSGGAEKHREGLKSAAWTA